MPTLRTYAIFISHDWEYRDEYYRIEEFLDETPNFSWRNLSVPEHNPLDNDHQLEENLRNQMCLASVVLILAGMEAARSFWIEREVEIALETKKPIVGIAPQGAKQLPRLVHESAAEIVGWQRQKIVDAIRRNALR